MKSKSIFLFFAAIILLLPAITLAADKPTKSSSRKGWKLVWKDDFKGKKIDTRSWTRCKAGTSDWDRHMSDLDSLCRVEKGVLQLWGINTPEGYDERPFITGGVCSKGLRSVKNGRFEVRAKLGCATGFWPAIWLMPDSKIGWPYGGEIDIMEHLSYEDIAYQTVHTPHTLYKREPTIQHYVTVPIKKDEFNVYAVELSESEVTFYVNGEKTFTYSKMEPTPEGQFPFADHPFYIILSAQLGGSWVGKINPNDLPVKMEIDYVRVYERR